MGSEDKSQHPLTNYQFNSEELRVLRECNAESFLKRSLPIGVGLGLTTYFAVRNGYLKGNVKYGSAPKIAVSVIFGYFLGKFSYKNKCAEKLMQLPDSKLGELLRSKQNGYLITQNHGNDIDLGLHSLQEPTNEDVNNVYTPPLNPETYFETDIAPNSTPVTYDELRKKNRESYKYSQPNAENTKISSNVDHNVWLKNETDVGSKVKTNKYGDNWSE